MAQNGRRDEGHPVEVQRHHSRRCFPDTHRALSLGFACGRHVLPEGQPAVPSQPPSVTLQQPSVTLQPPPITLPTAVGCPPTASGYPANRRRLPSNRLRLPCQPPSVTLQPPSVTLQPPSVTLQPPFVRGLPDSQEHRAPIPLCKHASRAHNGNQGGGLCAVHQEPVHSEAPNGDQSPPHTPHAHSLCQALPDARPRAPRPRTHIPRPPKRKPPNTTPVLHRSPGNKRMGHGVMSLCNPRPPVPQAQALSIGSQPKHATRVQQRCRVSLGISAAPCAAPRYPRLPHPDLRRKPPCARCPATALPVFARREWAPNRLATASRAPTQPPPPPPNQKHPLAASGHAPTSRTLVTSLINPKGGGGGGGLVGCTKGPLIET